MAYDDALRQYDTHTRMMHCVRAAMRRSLAAWILFASFSPMLGHPNLATGQSSQSSYYALVIGNNYSDSTSLPHLSTAENDAGGIGDVLRKEYDFKVQELIGRRATHDAILAAIDQYRTLSKGDNLVIYYAGHGAIDHQTERAYWVPSDGSRDSFQNYIGFDELVSAMETLPVRHALLISDSCYAGGLYRGTTEAPPLKGMDEYLKKMMAYPSRTIMAAGGKELVSDSGIEHHSIFTYYLIAALENTGQKVFAAHDLFGQLVQRPVANTAQQTPRYDYIRRPGNDNGDFVFIRAGTSAVARDRQLSSAAPDMEQTMELYKAGRFDEAFRRLQKGCETGDHRACAGLGVMYFTGEGVTRNAEIAFQLSQKSCADGDGDGCSNLGYLYGEGVVVPKDVTRAVELFRRSCGLGEMLGCSNLSYSYEAGIGVGKDPQRSTAYSRVACDGGLTEGCEKLGWDYLAGFGIASDPKKAFDLLSTACGQKSARGCSLVGLMYELGSAVDRNFSQSFAYSNQGCSLGDPYGCGNVGLDYINGKGVAVDEKTAFGFFVRGCDGKDGASCRSLATSYSNGVGTSANAVHASVLMRKACDLGDSSGCRLLASMYENGQGVARDPSLARQALQRACSLNDSTSCATVSH